jgi:hypothetical protein
VRPAQYDNNVADIWGLNVVRLSCCGILSFTYMAYLSLRIVGPQDLGQPVQRVAQRQQTNRTKRRSAGCNPPKLIRRFDIGPRDRDRAKPSVLILEDQPVLAPILAPADQLDLVTAERMEGMCDPHRLGGRTCMLCSRRRLPKQKSSRRCSSSSDGFSGGCAIEPSSV